MSRNIRYVSDSHVDEVLDETLRELLTLCFTKPEDVVFRERRYFFEPYPHRWLMYEEESGGIIAHAGVHEKLVSSGGCRYRVGGVAEVCVHPDCRGMGYMHRVLGILHQWLSAQGFDFSVLFGDPLVYGSSGYIQVKNLFYGSEEEGWEQGKAMVKTLSDSPWPDGKVYLSGERF